MALPPSHKPNVVLFLNLSFILLCFSFLATSTRLSPSPLSSSVRLSTLRPTSGDGCMGLEGVKGPRGKCSYLVSRTPCAPRGYIDYLRIFYCTCGGCPVLGYALLALWLLVLFYLLGNTASRYFCPFLESLSRVLRLPPALAGATLLSLGNGAPDVFASVVSFAASGAGEVGLSSVLGGALFVTSVVVGIISVARGGSRPVSIDRSGFVRDLGFLILVLCSLFAILAAGRIGFWSAVCFSSLYAVYVLVVWVGYCCRKQRRCGELEVPLLAESADLEDPIAIAKEVTVGDPHPECDSRASRCLSWSLRLLEMPLYLPRRLTIPDVSEERWSKPFAVASVFFSPLLLATLWDSQSGEMGSERSLVVYLSGGLAGIALGIAATETTEAANPPRKCLLPWLAGGFLMSVIWAYITARELVSLLVSLGHILGISPVILGLTVLAWGNSLSDLMANVAIAMSGGGVGVQIAISGCYAGPIFNTLVGLGLPMVLASWAAGPAPFVIPRDQSLFETLGFLLVALLWALVVLPARGMNLDKVLGYGLLTIYLCFLCLRLSESLGLVKFEMPFHV